MMVAIHQPQYLPWLGYLDKMDQADAFCFLDNVQFTKNEWQNRNRVRTREGWLWITVPVLHDFGQKVMDVRINNLVPWAKKHRRTLKQCYSRAQHYKEWAALLDEVLEKPWEKLSDLNIAAARALAQAFGVSTRLVRASKMGPLPDTPNERLIAILKAMGADTYLAGSGGKNYMDLSLFEEAGIRVAFQDFRHPEYTQAQPGFVAGLSAVDLLYNCGSRGMDLVREKNPPEIYRG